MWKIFKLELNVLGPLNLSSGVGRHNFFCHKMLT